MVLGTNVHSFQLKPIERFAINLLEAEYKPEFEEECKEAEVCREEFIRSENIQRFQLKIQKSCISFPI